MNDFVGLSDDIVIVKGGFKENCSLSGLKTLIMIYAFVLFLNIFYQIEKDQICCLKEVLMETIVRAFCWAQWDAIHQSLYFIHYRKPPPVAVEGEVQDELEVAPILSALQFHDDMPHETVVSK